MVEFQITCIKQQDGTEHQHIVSVGIGPAKQSLTVAQVLAFMKDGDKFFVSDGSNKAYVLEVRVLDGASYIRTHRDGVLTDNLLALPQCR
jgi:hypothetical protein